MRQRTTDAMVEIGDRLATGERDGVRVALPIRGPVTGDEGVECEPVAVRPRIVLPESRIDHDLRRIDTQGGRQDAGRFERPRVAARPQARSAQFVGVSQPFGESSDLQPTEVRQPGTGARTADHTGHRGGGLAVPHEGEAHQRRALA